MLEHAAEVLDLLRHQQPGRRFADVMDDALGGRVGAVSGAERIVDVDVGERGELLRERGVVLFFFRRGSAGSRAGRRRLGRAFATALAAASPIAVRRRTSPAGRGAPPAVPRPGEASTPGSVSPSAVRGATPG